MCHALPRWSLPRLPPWKRSGSSRCNSHDRQKQRLPSRLALSVLALAPPTTQPSSPLLLQPPIVTFSFLSSPSFVLNSRPKPKAVAFYAAKRDCTTGRDLKRGIPRPHPS